MLYPFEPRPLLRILLAADNLVNRQVTLSMLQQMGYSAMVVSHGAEVLAVLQQHSYDVVLMDVHLPRIDGLAIARRIRQTWAADRRPQVIAMGASLRQLGYDLCLTEGVDGYIAKPVQFEELEATLRWCRPLVPSLQSSAAANSQNIGTTQPFAPQDYSVPQASVSQALSGVAESVATLGLATEPPLDYKVLDGLRRSMGHSASTALPKLIDCYLTEASKQVQSMQHMIGSQDSQGLRRLAHTLKSSSCALGATVLFHLCKTLEDYGRLGMLEQAAETIVDLEQEFRRFKAALEQERG